MNFHLQFLELDFKLTSVEYQTNLIVAKSDKNAF